MFNELIDIKEENLLSVDSELLNILLKDNSSGRNIIWATNDYKYNGIGFEFESEITISKITGSYKDLIKPRSKKIKKKKKLDQKIMQRFLHHRGFAMNKIIWQMNHGLKGQMYLINPVIKVG